MASIQLKERVAKLETEVRTLKRRMGRGRRIFRPWWEEIAGTFAGDPAYRLAMQLGRKYRLSLKLKSPRTRKRHNGSSRH